MKTLPKTLLEKGGHYLHFYPGLTTSSPVWVYYSKNPKSKEAEPVTFTVPQKSWKTTAIGWECQIEYVYYEQVVISLGMDQEWDEVEFKSYPIYPTALPKTKKVSPQAKSMAAYLHGQYLGYEKDVYYQTHKAYDSEHTWHGHYEAPKYEIEEEKLPQWEQDLYDDYQANQKIVNPLGNLVTSNALANSIFSAKDKIYNFTLYYKPDLAEYTLKANFAGKEYVGWSKVYLSKSKTVDMLYAVKEEMIKQITMDVSNF